MKLYLISNIQQTNDNSNLVTCKLLTDACEVRGIEYEILDPATVNPLKVQLQPGDGLYRIATAHYNGAAELEYMLVNPQVATFLNNPLSLGDRRDATMYAKLNIAAPKTVNYVPSDRKVLLEVVEELGGFPVILKAMGGSHGVGVMRLDSPESLFSVSDFARHGGSELLLKEYCSVRSSARLIVLGDKVIDSIEYSAPKGDFRSNEGASPNVSPRRFDTEVEQLAVHATNAQGLEFGGVDIMLTDDGPKVAEVNFPCFFPRCQMLTGTDIAGQMVDYLRKKSERIMDQQ